MDRKNVRHILNHCNKCIIAYAAHDFEFIIDQLLPDLQLSRTEFSGKVIILHYQRHVKRMIEGIPTQNFKGNNQDRLRTT